MVFGLPCFWETLLPPRWQLLFYFSVFLCILLFILCCHAGPDFAITGWVTGLCRFILERNPASVHSSFTGKMGNGEENTMYWQLQTIILSVSFAACSMNFLRVWQIRDFKMKTRLDPGEIPAFFYVQPVERGEFVFGDLHLFFKSPLHADRATENFYGQRIHEGISGFPHAASI